MATEDARPGSLSHESMGTTFFEAFQTCLHVIATVERATVKDGIVNLT